MVTRSQGVEQLGVQGLYGLKERIMLSCGLGVDGAKCADRKQKQKVGFRHVHFDPSCAGATIHTRSRQDWFHGMTESDIQVPQAQDGFRNDEPTVLARQVEKSRDRLPCKRGKPLLVRNFHALRLTAGARVFVPLCGKSLDLHWLIEQGYQVAGAELSQLAVIRGTQG